ncbi:MAG: energy-coupling factor transporter transmembrane protein EcfT [Bacilli bacterium]|nr:energy-coupling factor transporter transmembrane protein EcfT [Bacilli bacterium]
MNNLAFGQYYHTNSVIHRMDPRTKILSSLLFMIGLFIIPKNNFLFMGIFALFMVITILLTKVPLKKFLKSIKFVTYLLLFSFVFQVLFNSEGELLLTINHNLTLVNVGICLVVLICLFLLRKKIPLFFILFLVVLVLGVKFLEYPVYGNVLLNYDIKVYTGGVITGAFVISRVLILIISSAVLTLTTKPTDLNNGLEALLKPFGKKTSILAMMISIALRFIPTLFLETEKILKAQASRGVDFNEGKLKDKIGQIVSLLVPMFIISFKRAADLADAMEARGYVPGEKRTKLVKMNFTLKDVIYLLSIILIITIVIIYRVI